MPFMIRFPISKISTCKCKYPRNMDTNNLTEKAYEILTIAEGIDHTVTVNLGAICSRLSNEDDFLQVALEYMHSIIGNPKAFLENWGLDENLEIEDFAQSIINLMNLMERVMQISIKDRGRTIEEIFYR